MLIEAEEDPRYRKVMFTWVDDGSEPADVMVRLLTVASKAREDGDLSPVLMTRHDDGVWRLTVRLRADFRSAYQMCPWPKPLAGQAVDDQAWHAIIAAGIADPSNPATFGALYGNPGPSSILELPNAPAQPWLNPRPDTAAGDITEHTLSSVVFGNTRKVWVYTPAGYDQLHDVAVAVLLDGDCWAALGVNAILDNMIAEGAIPPTVTVMMQSMTGVARQAELTDHPRFLRLLLDELMPWVQAGWRVTADPARTVLAGQSFGGLMAAYAGLHAWRSFGNIITQSGSFWWPGGSEFDVNAGELIRQFVDAERIPVRFYQEAGTIEWLLLAQNRHLRDVLRAKGYQVTYREFHGGHDYACWRAGLPHALAALLGAR